MNDQKVLPDGPLRAGISNAMVRIQHEFYGKGPQRAKTYTLDNYVFAVLEEGLTTTEVTLKESGEEELVREVRLAFEDMMTKTFGREVEKLTGRRVVGYHSQIVFDPDIAFEFFILEPEAAAPTEASLTGESAAMEGPDVERATPDEPGEVGNADALAGTSSPVTEGADAPSATPGGACGRRSRPRSFGSPASSTALGRAAPRASSQGITFSVRWRIRSRPSSAR